MSTRHSRSSVPSLVLDAKVARIVGGADPLPAAGAPSSPPDQKALPRREARRILRPRKAQLDVAPEAARELRESKSFSEFILPRIARPAELADAIEFASAWNREARASQAWSTYAGAQSALAWDGLLTALAKVRAPLVAAQGADSALEKELHAFARLVTAKSDGSKRLLVGPRQRQHSGVQEIPHAIPLRLPHPA
jgi:hypothetical protein